MSHLAVIVGLLVALSVASERLVEIVKGVVPFLRDAHTDPKKEGWRKAVLQLLGVVAGIVTALLASPTIPEGVLPATGTTAIVALGLLASGGSGFWNAILAWVLQVKNISKQAAEEKALHVRALKKSLNVPVV